jgi:hypothetical protein
MVVTMLCLIVETGSIAQQVQSDARTFVVKYEIVDGDRVIGRPHIIIADGGTGTVDSEAFALRSTLSPVPGGREDARLVASDLSLRSGGKLMRVASPQVTGQIGKATTVGITRSGHAPLTMTVLVEER